MDQTNNNRSNTETLWPGLWGPVLPQQCEKEARELGKTYRDYTKTAADLQSEFAKIRDSVLPQNPGLAKLFESCFLNFARLEASIETALSQTKTLCLSVKGNLDATAASVNSVAVVRSSSSNSTAAPFSAIRSSNMPTHRPALTRMPNSVENFPEFPYYMGPPTSYVSSMSSHSRSTASSSSAAFNPLPPSSTSTSSSSQAKATGNSEAPPEKERRKRKHAEKPDRSSATKPKRAKQSPERNTEAAKSTLSSNSEK